MSNLARELQTQVAEYLKSKIDTNILVEDQRDIEFEIKNALQKQGIVTVVMTPKMSYLGHDGKYQAWQIDDLTIMTTEYVNINRAKNKPSWKSGFDISFEINDNLAGPNAEIGFGRFCPIDIEQGEDNNLLVTKSRFSTTIQHIDLPIPTTGGQFTVHISGINIEAVYNESTQHWEWTGPGYRSHLELWYDEAESAWKCMYSPNPQIQPETTTSTQPVDAKELTFENGWTANWGKIRTKEGTMTADFTDDLGNPIIATWNHTNWMAQMLGYSIIIEQSSDIWKLYITNSHGGSWTLISDQDLTDTVVTFEGDNPLRYRQTWTWSK